MKIKHRLQALLAQCRERQRLAAILLLPLVLPIVFAGCASQGVKGAYFDAVEVNTIAPTTVAGVTSSNLPIYTKVAGIPFNLDILAGMYKTDNTTIVYQISGQYAAGDSNVDLVDLSAPGCSSACNSGSVTVGATCQLAGVTVTANQPTTHAYGGGTGSSGSAYYNWTGGELGRKTYYGFTVPTAAANVRVRIYGKACGGFPYSCTTATMCSTDAFTVRPASFTVTSSVASGTTLAAGTNYTMTATAVKASGATITTYTGTPVLTTTNVTGWKAGGSIGTFAGSFGAAVAGVSTGASFNYSDFGPLTIPVGAIADSNYVSSAGSGDVAGNDCVAGSSSNVLTVAPASPKGQYGCNIGNQVAITTPTFIPHHYTATHTITPACSNTFTYLGQPFNYRLTVDAFNASNARMTRLTAGASNKPTMNITQYNSGSLIGSGPVTIPNSNLVWSDDSTYGTASGGEYFTSTTTVAPYVLGTLALTTTRPAGLSYASAAPPDYESFVLRTTSSDANITTCNGVVVGGSTTCDSAATKLRYGVLKLNDGISTSLTPATVQISAQYWNGSSFVTNTDDSCTAINFNTGTLASSATPRPVAKNASTTLSSGVGALMLSTSLASNLAIRLGGSDNNCVSATASTVTTPNALSGYLGGVSCSASFDKDPSAGITFGTLRSTYIYRAEKF